jgi:DNA-binding transcriptional ArsR family regulator
MELSTLKIFKALANEKRLQIMLWILSPRDHFPPQQDGDLVRDGVCVGFITNKIGLSQPTVTSHMKILAEAGLVTSKQIKNWVFYKPVPDLLIQTLKQLSDTISVEVRSENSLP